MSPAANGPLSASTSPANDDRCDDGDCRPPFLAHPREKALNGAIISCASEALPKTIAVRLASLTSSRHLLPASPMSTRSAVCFFSSTTRGSVCRIPSPRRVCPDSLARPSSQALRAGRSRSAWHQRPRIPALAPALASTAAGEDSRDSEGNNGVLCDEPHKSILPLTWRGRVVLTLLF